MEEILGGIICMLLAIALIPLYFWKRRNDSRSEHQHRDEPQIQQPERVVHPTVGRRMRRRPAAAGSSIPSTSSRQETYIESDDEIAEDDNYVAKASSKKERKKQEREAQRQAEEAARESRKTKQDYYEATRRKKDEEREEEERLREEEALARKAKEEEAAALEFEKWKGAFSVDEEGTTEETQEEGQGLLSNFVEYIKDQKCVPLEDLAAEFKMRTQDCIDRIITLESMGRLSGVMDDRGKYIYISPEEMKAVADYIIRQGRVSISHLASKSNQFIDLQPKPQLDSNTPDELSVA